MRQRFNSKADVRLWESNVCFVRTADLGVLEHAARCHEGPVWMAPA